MSIDESTQTMNVGNHDWLEASKDMQIRGYLPPAEQVEVIAESIEKNIQVTVTSYKTLIPYSQEWENARLTEELNEVYEGELEEEEEEIMRHVKEYHRRRLSAE